MQGECKEGWGQRVPLLDSLSLVHVVHGPAFVAEHPASPELKSELAFFRDGLDVWETL